MTGRVTRRGRAPIGSRSGGQPLGSESSLFRHHPSPTATSASAEGWRAGSSVTASDVDLEQGQLRRWRASVVLEDELSGAQAGFEYRAVRKGWES